MQFTGKTVEEATELGLKELGITKEQADIAILEEPKKGLFGKLKGKAVLDIVKKDDFELNFKEKAGKKEKSEKPEKPKKAEKQESKPQEKKTENKEKEPKEPKEKLTQEDIEKTKKFIKELLSLLNIDAETSVNEDDENVVFTLSGENTSAVIGYRGEVLDAIQTIAGAYANIGKKDYQKVVVDCENYRDKREETLIKLAKRLEEKATNMKREVILEPMNPFERRIIHTALADSTTVTTRSDGKEPNRYVVIVPNEKDEFSKPYNAGRNSDKGSHGGHSGRSHGGHGGKRDFKRSNKGSGFIETKKKSSISFGAYLGNSLKDNK